MSYQQTLPTVFDACEPRDDVLGGELAEDQFAANLASVAFDPEDTAPVYRKADAFFNSTYPTDGLKTLLSTLTSQFLVTTGHEPAYNASILCLDTSFGGGKTHDLIAAYHLAASPADITDLDPHLANSELGRAYTDAVDNGLSPRTAVFVGDYVDVRNARCDTDDPEAPNTNTMWGELAYQLYGTDGYELLKEYDQNRDKPGENTLRNLFNLSDDPVLILIDELAEYITNAAGYEVGEKTLADLTLTFMKSLLETASNVKNVTVVYSIADTAFTEEAERIRDKLKELDSIEQRQQRTITPTGDNEVGAVLRNRLFDEIDDNAARTVAEAYSDFYRDTEQSLPQKVQDVSYESKLEQNYPLHPTIKDALTKKIDSIPSFQKTRDALRLIARGVYYLWNHQPDAYDRHFFRLYDLTPADDAPSGSIRTKLSESLFDAVELDSALDADVYSSDGSAHAQIEDEKWTKKGFPQLGSHVATTVLWNSLAYGEKALGVTRAELYAAVGHPAIEFDHYDSAIDNLTSNDEQVGSYYLYDEDRLKFKQKAKLLYIIDKYKQNTQRAKARNRFEGEIRSEIGTGGFKTVPSASPESSFPEEPADVEDDPTTPTLAVLHFESLAITDGGDDVPDQIKTLYEKTAASHGGQIEPRSYQNYVLFLVPDAELVETGIEKARRLEGMERLRDNSEDAPELTDEQLEDLNNRIKETKGLIGEQVRNAYRHLFYPDQGGLEHIPITTVDANGGTTFVEAVETTLDDRILRDDSGARGEAWFTKHVWQQNKRRMTTRQLEEQFARKPGLPFLFSTKPLRKTVARMVREAGYAYWDDEAEIAYWSGGDTPENWEHGSALEDSPDVQTTISGTDVKISGEKNSDDYLLYEDMAALLEQHSVGPGVTTCTECGDKIAEPINGPPHYCTDHRAQCAECGSDIPGTPQSPDDTYCSECKSPVTSSSWEVTSEMAAAQRAFREARDDGIAAVSTDETPSLEEITIEVGGDSVLSHGFFMADRVLDDYADETSVHMQYHAEADDETEFKARFDGGFDAFQSLNKQLEQFTDDTGRRRVDLTFTIELADPDPLTKDEDDILALLRDELDETGITVQVEASGSTAAEVEA